MSPQKKMAAQLRADLQEFLQFLGGIAVLALLGAFLGWKFDGYEGTGSAAIGAFIFPTFCSFTSALRGKLALTKKQDNVIFWVACVLSFLFLVVVTPSDPRQRPSDWTAVLFLVGVMLPGILYLFIGRMVAAGYGTPDPPQSQVRIGPEEESYEELKKRYGDKETESSYEEFKRKYNNES